jgi:hypothetical protein
LAEDSKVLSSSLGTVVVKLTVMLRREALDATEYPELQLPPPVEVV